MTPTTLPHETIQNARLVFDWIPDDIKADWAMQSYPIEDIILYIDRKISKLRAEEDSPLLGKCQTEIWTKEFSYFISGKLGLI